MKRCIIINWKWMSVPPCKEGLSPNMTELQKWAVEDSKDEIWCLNLPREEAAFEGEYGLYYDEPNELLLAFIQEYFAHREVLLFLHKNAPHYYGAYDVQYFIDKGLSNTVLFGGGENFVYDLQNPKGLLDQVGSFSQKAIVQKTEIKAPCFNSIWSHYVEGVKPMLHQFSRKILPYLLPSTTAEIPAQLQAEALTILQAMNAKPSSLPLNQQKQLANRVWPRGFIEVLQQLSQGNKQADAKLLRDTVDALT